MVNTDAMITIINDTPFHNYSIRICSAQKEEVIEIHEKTHHCRYNTKNVTETIRIEKKNSWKNKNIFEGFLNSVDFVFSPLSIDKYLPFSIDYRVDLLSGQEKAIHLSSIVCSDRDSISRWQKANICQISFVVSLLVFVETILVVSLHGPWSLLLILLFIGIDMFFSVKAVQIMGKKKKALKQFVK